MLHQTEDYKGLHGQGI